MKKKVKVKRNSKAQVWVETVIYTLIAFAMIGLVLSFIKPKIEESQDKAIIEQSIQIVQDLDGIIQNIRDIPGNKRKLNFYIEEGTFQIDSEKDRLIFALDSKYEYSEPNQTIQQGNVEITTLDRGEFKRVIIQKKYSDSLNITYNSRNKLKTLSASSTPYQIFLTNEGDSGDKTNINIEVN